MKPQTTFLAVVSLAGVLLGPAPEARGDGFGFSGLCLQSQPTGTAINVTVGVQKKTLEGETRQFDVTLSTQSAGKLYFFRARILLSSTDTQTVTSAICALLTTVPVDASDTLEVQILNTLGLTGPLHVTERSVSGFVCSPNTPNCHPPGAPSTGLILGFLGADGIETAVADITLYAKR